MPAWGFLVNQFMSSFTNKRTDKYGGTPEKRAQIVVEIIANIQKKAGKDFPISCRISGEDLLAEGGNTLEDTRIIAPVLEKAGLSMIKRAGRMAGIQCGHNQFLCAPRGFRLCG